MNPFRNVRANLRALATTIPNLRANWRTVLEQTVAWVITGGIHYLWSLEPGFWQTLAIFLGVNLALGAVIGVREVRRRRRGDQATTSQPTPKPDTDGT